VTPTAVDLTRDPAKALSRGGVSELLDAAALWAPNRRALDFAGRKWSYREVHDLVDRAAASLERLGVGRGDRVGLCLPNSPDYAVAFFAVLRIGAIVVQCNPLYTARELEHILADSGARVLIVSDLETQIAATLEVQRRQPSLTVLCCPMPVSPPRTAPSIPSEWARFADLPVAPPDRIYPPTDPGDAAVLQYTGGTTGAPKGAILTHGNLTANCEQIRLHLRLEQDTQHCALAVLPLFHVFALTTVLLLSVRVAAEIVLLPRFELNSLLPTIARTRPTLLSAVPTIYGAINGAAADHLPDFSSLLACISGGAPLPFDVREAFEKRTGARLVEGYGLTEASPVVTCNPIDRPPRDHSAGVALPGARIEIRALDDPLREAAVGETGEVCVRGPQVMKGYWRRDEETARVLQDGLLRTGDVGYLDEDGYLFLVDRIKDVILCGGYNVYPRVIEDALYEHPAVAEAIALGMPDAYRGETPHAYVALRTGMTVTPEALRVHLAERLSKIEMPAVIEVRPSLPRTAVGKLSRKDLRAAIEEGRSAAGPPPSVTAP